MSYATQAPVGRITVKPFIPSAQSLIKQELLRMQSLYTLERQKQIASSKKTGIKPPQSLLTPPKGSDVNGPLAMTRDYNNEQNKYMAHISQLQQKVLAGDTSPQTITELTASLTGFNMLKNQKSAIEAYNADLTSYKTQTSDYQGYVALDNNGNPHILMNRNGNPELLDVATTVLIDKNQTLARSKAGTVAVPNLPYNTTNVVLPNTEDKAQHDDFFNNIINKSAKAYESSDAAITIKGAKLVDEKVVDGKSIVTYFGDNKALSRYVAQSVNANLGSLTMNRSFLQNFWNSVNEGKVFYKFDPNTLDYARDEKGNPEAINMTQVGNELIKLRVKMNTILKSNGASNGAELVDTKENKAKTAYDKLNKEYNSLYASSLRQFALQEAALRGAKKVYFKQTETELGGSSITPERAFEMMIADEKNYKTIPITSFSNDGTGNKIYKPSNEEGKINYITGSIVYDPKKFGEIKFEYDKAFPGEYSYFVKDIDLKQKNINLDVALDSFIGGAEYLGDEAFWGKYYGKDKTGNTNKVYTGLLSISKSIKDLNQRKSELDATLSKTDDDNQKKIIEKQMSDLAYQKFVLYNKAKELLPEYSLLRQVITKGIKNDIGDDLPGMTDLTSRFNPVDFRGMLLPTAISKKILKENSGIPMNVDHFYLYGNVITKEDMKLDDIYLTGVNGLLLQETDNGKLKPITVAGKSVSDAALVSVRAYIPKDKFEKLKAYIPEANFVAKAVSLDKSSVKNKFGIKERTGVELAGIYGINKSENPAFQKGVDYMEVEMLVPANSLTIGGKPLDYDIGVSKRIRKSVINSNNDDKFSKIRK